MHDSIRPLSGYLCLAMRLWPHPFLGFLSVPSLISSQSLWLVTTLRSASWCRQMEEWGG